MEYKVRKGLETPCRIGIFLSGDYWVVYSASVAAIGLCVLAAAQGLTEGRWKFYGACWAYAVWRSLCCAIFWRKTLSPEVRKPEPGKLP